MNNPMSATRVESGKNNLRIKVLLDKLRTKLKNFSVLDSTSHLIGEVKDVKLDKSRQLNLLISRPEPYTGSGLFLLRSNHIQQVDSVTKSLFVDLSRVETENLAEYKLPENQGLELSEPSSTPAGVAPQVIDQYVTQVSNMISENTQNTDNTDGHEVNLQATNMPTPADLIERQEELEHEGSFASHETTIVEEEVFRLLEERLVVDSKKRKVGEVIVRKEIETRMVEVPVRYEKLIVEQISPEHKQLAEILLGEGEITGIDLTEIATSQAYSNPTGTPTVKGEFTSPKSASLFLNAIALQRHHGCTKVRVELVLEDAELQKTYQEWFARCAGS